MEDSFSLQKFGFGKATSGSLWGIFELENATGKNSTCEGFGQKCVRARSLKPSRGMWKYGTQITFTLTPHVHAINQYHEFSN